MLSDHESCGRRGVNVHVDPWTAVFYENGARIMVRAYIYGFGAE